MIRSYAVIESQTPLPSELIDALTQAGIESTAGRWCSAQAPQDANYLLATNQGSLYVKYRRHPPIGLFRAEAAGLAALAATATLPVVEVVSVGDHFIALNHLPLSPPNPASWERAGAGLAALHRHSNDRFGFGGNNFCGDSPQSNRWEVDGHRFFAEQRLLFQGEMALRRGLLPHAALRALERLCGQLTELLPVQPVALLHGDLWSGNCYCSGGEWVLIDPAAHYGWAEAELAMTSLFGGFPAAFYAAYAAAAGIDPGWRGRSELYNLYHLLNHLNLFGLSYLTDVSAILACYTDYRGG